jgi:hypothetical protein
LVPPAAHRTPSSPWPCARCHCRPGRYRVRTIGGGRLSASARTMALRTGIRCRFPNSTRRVHAQWMRLTVYIADRDNGTIESSTSQMIVRTLSSWIRRARRRGHCNSDVSMFLLRSDGRITVRPFSECADWFGLSSPTALAVDSRTNVFVTEEGTLLRIRASDSMRTLVARDSISRAGLRRWTAVIGGERHRKNLIRFIPGERSRHCKSAPAARVQDGPPARAKFNHPQPSRKLPAGIIVAVPSSTIASV